MDSVVRKFNPPHLVTLGLLQKKAQDGEEMGRTGGIAVDVRGH